ncbi:tetratricopeptide repeat protein, partial [Candidatus Dependentiae bacterium]|nr:tetratricopeptide repeat protein [Candidatus Dependentiae bacterium]
PFYIEELASLLLNSDMIKIQKDIAKLKTGEFSAIPLKLNELIMAKVDQLNLGLKNILHIASVIGREFSTRILENIIELGAELRTDLDLIEKKELIVRLNREIEQHLREDEYAFKHVIIKDVVYNSILKSERKKQHRFVGETIETLYANNLDDYFDILIHHFRLGKDKQQLLIYLLKSAEKEKKFGHYVKSEKLYEEYLDVIGESIFKTKDGIEICLGFVGLKQIIAKYDDGLKILKDIEDKGKTFLKGELFVKFNLRKIDILTSLGKYEEAFKLSKDAEEMLTNITEPGEELKGYCFNCIGNMYFNKGEFDKSLEYFQKSLEIRLKVLSPDYLDVARSYLGLGIVYGTKGELDKAIEYFQKSLDINLKSLGDKHPTVAASYGNIGVIYKMKGEFDMALKYFQKAMDIDLKVLSNEHPDFVMNYLNIGSVYGSKGEYDKALKYFQKSLDIGLKSLSDDHPDLAVCYNNIGGVYLEKCEYGKALEYIKKGLEIILNVLGPDHIRISYSYYDLAKIHYELKDYDKAMNYIDKAVKIRIDKLGSDHRITGESEFLFAKILIKLDRIPEAKKHLKTAIKIGGKHKRKWVKDAEELLKKVR